MAKGTRAKFFALPWYHPDCQYMLQRNHPYLPHNVVTKGMWPLFTVILLRGNHPPVPTCHCRLSSVSRSRRGS